MKLIPKNAKSAASTEWYVDGKRVENILTRSVTFTEDGTYSFTLKVKYKKGEENEVSKRDKGKVVAGLDEQLGATEGRSSSNNDKVSDS